VDWIGWPRIGTDGELLWIRYWTFGFHKMLGNIECLTSSAQLHRVGVRVICMSRLSKQCGILDFSQHCRPPLSATVIALLFLLLYSVCEMCTITTGCSLLWKWASGGLGSQPWRTSYRKRRSNSGRFQKKPSAGVSINGRIDGASVCVGARVLLWRRLGKRCHMSYHYNAIPAFRELFDCPSYVYQYWNGH
jgi:hypothetical protein